MTDSNAKHTAEPLDSVPHLTAETSTGNAYDDTGMPIVVARDSRLTDRQNGKRIARIVACVNACAGVEDPAAAIEGARKALRAAGMSLRRSWGDGVKSYPESIRDALRALGAKP